MKYFMRCVVFIIFISALLLVGAQQTIASDSLNYIGHAFVKIKTSEGIVIYIDPYAVNAFADSADIVLITHEHGDHNDSTKVKRKSTCTTIRSKTSNVGGVYKSFTIGSVKVTAVPAYNGNHPKVSCVGYVVEFNGIKLYHAGDTGNIPEMADLDTLDLDYALLPMEGTYTVTPEVATLMAAKINAKHDMPIHTMAPPDTYSDAAVAKFTSPNKIIVHPGETIALVHTPTAVQEVQIAPSKFELKQSYPNPFNPSTTIEYQIPERGLVTLTVFDILGKEIAKLVNEEKTAGPHNVQWNASNVPSSVYFYQLKSGNFAETKRMVLLK